MRFSRRHNALYGLEDVAMVVARACDGGTTMQEAASRIPGGPRAKRVMDRLHGVDPAGL